MKGKKISSLGILLFVLLMASLPIITVSAQELEEHPRDYYMKVLLKDENNDTMWIYDTLNDLVFQTQIAQAKSLEQGFAIVGEVLAMPGTKHGFIFNWSAGFFISGMILNPITFDDVKTNPIYYNGTNWAFLVTAIDPLKMINWAFIEISSIIAIIIVIGNVWLKKKKKI